MLQERRLEISRNCWKKKAVIRGTKLRELRKERRKSQERNQWLKDENRRLDEELKKKSNRSPPLH